MAGIAVIIDMTIELSNHQLVGSLKMEEIFFLCGNILPLKIRAAFYIGEGWGFFSLPCFFSWCPRLNLRPLVPRHLKNKEGPLAPPFSYKLRSVVVADYVILLITLHDIIFQ
jgi:hypothetical protein